MKRTYGFKLKGDNYWYKRGNKELSLCVDELREAFDVRETETAIDVVVQTEKPRGDNYHVINFHRGAGCPTLDYDNDHVVFSFDVDVELDRFGKYPLYVSVYA